MRRAKERLALTAPPNRHYPFSVHVLALAHYRAGDHAAAVECLSNDPSPNDFEAVKVLNWLVLAVAEEKRDHTAAARKWFAQADQWLAEKNRQLPPGGPVVPPNWLWRDWLLVQTLHREAQRVLADKR